MEAVRGTGNVYLEPEKRQSSALRASRGQLQDGFKGRKQILLGVFLQRLAYEYVEDGVEKSKGENSAWAVLLIMRMNWEGDCLLKDEKGLRVSG